MSQTIFLSTVSKEFGPLRQRLALLLQRTKRVHVRHQDDFFHHGVKTLQMLEEEVAASKVIIHVIGQEAGWSPPVDQVQAFLTRHPEFASQFPQVLDDARVGRVSATQWEIWLALYFRLPRILIYEFSDRMSAGSSQAIHSARLRGKSPHPKSVDSDDALYDEIIGSLLGLGFLMQDDIRRPLSLPYPSIGRLFQGRDAFLAELRSSLRRSGDGRATAVTGKAVHGLGGVGKTRLAVEYAWQHAEEFSAVLFVIADSTDALRRNLAELTGPLVLNLPEHTATEEEIRFAAAVRWLQQHPGWFLILDNVDDEDSAAAAEDLLARLHGGQVLITSRMARWSDAVEALELDVLAPEDAARLLLEKTAAKTAGRSGRGRKLTPKDESLAPELARILDGLALAIEQAAAYIVARGKSLAEYVALWNQHDTTVQTWHDHRKMKYPRSVAVTWHTTLDQLGDDERELLNILAWLSPEPVPLRVLSKISEISHGAITPASLDGTEQSNPTKEPDSGRSSADTNRGEAAWDHSRLESALSTLSDFSMLRLDIPAETVTVHRVVQEILRTRQSNPHSSLTAALQILDAAIPDGAPSDVRTWPAWEQLRPHVAFSVQEGKHLKIPIPSSRLMG